MKLIGSIVLSSAGIFAAVVGLYIAAAESRTDSGINLATRPHLDQAQFAINDRRPIVDARHAPYSAIGKFRGTMTCTASVVLHPRIIVTAGHCITKKDGSLKLSNLLFQPGYQAGDDLGQFKATLWAVGSKQNFRQESVHEASQDWAILLLDRTPAGVQPFLMSHQTFAELKFIGKQLLMPSYSIDVAHAERLSLDPACSVRNTAWHVFLHDCRASFGSSGAPLLMRLGPQYAIVGIHTGSMYASDDKGRVGRFVGNRAIGSEAFADELLALLQRLKSDRSYEVASGTY